MGVAREGDRIVEAEGGAAAGSAQRAALLAPLARQRTILLTTFRRDGTPVGTPVHLAVAGGR